MTEESIRQPSPFDTTDVRVENALRGNNGRSAHREFIAEHCQAAAHMAAEPQAVRRARNLVAKQLDACCLHEYVHPAQLVMSELATNAVEASPAGEVITVGVLVTDQTITLICCDASSGMPETQPAADFDEGGRGLQIVASLSKEWGVTPMASESGKVVWATLEITG